MREFQFDKGPYIFSFRNPHIYEMGDMYLRYEYEITRKDEGSTKLYSYIGTFRPSTNSLEFKFPHEIDGKKFNSVLIPDSLKDELLKFYSQEIEKYKFEKINQDFKYKLNDITSYGIYNGISEKDIRHLVSKIANELGLKNIIDYKTENIAAKVNRIKSIEELAMKTYEPYPEHSNWTEEYKEIHRKLVKNKKAVGNGIVPNAIIKEVVTAILTEIAEKKLEKSNRIKDIFNRAKDSGERQILSRWIEEVDEEDNSMYFCIKWAMPDGSTTVTKNPAF